MRCEACDVLLEDVDATAKFADGRFVCLCGVCRGWLPSDVKIVLRRDLMNIPKDFEVNQEAPPDPFLDLDGGEEWDDS